MPMPAQDMTKAVLVSVRLPRALARALDQEARKARRTRSDLIRELLEAGLDAKGVSPASRLRRIEREARALRREWKAR